MVVNENERYNIYSTHKGHLLVNKNTSTCLKWWLDTTLMSYSYLEKLFRIKHKTKDDQVSEYSYSIGWDEMIHLLIECVLFLRSRSVIKLMSMTGRRSLEPLF